MLKTVKWGCGPSPCRCMGLNCPYLGGIASLWSGCPNLSMPLSHFFHEIMAQIPTIFFYKFDILKRIVPVELNTCFSATAFRRLRLLQVGRQVHAGGHGKSAVVALPRWAWSCCVLWPSTFLLIFLLSNE